MPRASGRCRVFSDLTQLNMATERRPTIDHFEVLRMLFETHHAQLAEKRRKIHSTTERTVAVLVVITGWLVLGKQAPSGVLRCLLVTSVAVMAGTSCVVLYKNARSYSSIAGVIRKLNRAFGLHEQARHLPEGALYPDSWKSFGEEPPIYSILHHWVVIIAAGLVCIIATLVR